MNLKEINIDSAWVDWNGEKKTLDGSGLSWSKTITSLSEGDYTYRVYANDSYDNSNATEERIVTVAPYNITFNLLLLWERITLRKRRKKN